MGPNNPPLAGQPTRIRNVMQDKALIIPIPKWWATHLHIFPKGGAYRTLATSKCIGPNNIPKAGQPNRIRKYMLDKALIIPKGRPPNCNI